MNSEKDRLIELIRKQRKLCNDKNCGSCGYAKFGGYPDCQNKMLAHELIENGVIVPPCKVGDKIYTVGVHTGQIVSHEVVGIQYGINDVFLHLESATVVSVVFQLGETVFLTKEEAEEKLKELKDNV